MKKIFFLTLAVSFFAVGSLVSQAQAGKPTQIQAACNTACGTDTDCKGKCKAYCNGPTVCPVPTNKPKNYPNADGQSYKDCLTAKCTKDAIMGGAGASTDDSSADANS